MANGLRKLIRNTRRFSSPLLSRRAEQQSRPRLKVEELEERIAPAVDIALTPGQFLAWDAGDGDGAFNASDGFIGLGSNSTGIDSIEVAAVTDGGGTDTATLNIVVNDSAAGAASIYIYTNKAIGDVDISGLDAGTTNLTLVVVAGFDPAAMAGGEISVGTGGVLDDQENAGGGGIPVIANGDDFDAIANAAHGNYDVGATDFTGMTVTATLTAAGTGAIGDLDFSDSTDDAGTNLTGTITSGDTIGAIDVGGTLGTGATELTMTAAGDITSITTAGGYLNLASSIEVSEANIGAVDIGGVFAGSMSTVTSGNIDDVSVTGGVTGSITSAGTMADIDVSGSLSGSIEAASFNAGEARTLGGVATTGSMTATTGDLDGTSLTITGSMEGTIEAAAGAIASDISTTGAISGTIQAPDAAAGDITGNITGATGLTGNVSISAGNDITGDIEATAGGFASTGAISAGNDITGNVNVAGEFAGTMTADNDISGDVDITDAGTGELSGTISAGNDITGGAITIAAGITGTGTIQADRTIDSTIDVTTGGIAARTVADTYSIRADADGDAVGDIEGAVTVAADGFAGAIRAWNVDADIDVTGAFTGDVTVDNDLTAGILAQDADIAGSTILIGNDISATGMIDAVAENITAATNILVDNDMLGTISAAKGVDANIEIGGALGGTVDADDGDISGLSVVGAISSASGNVSISATGGSVDVTAGSISATGGNTVTIEADDDVTVDLNNGGVSADNNAGNSDVTIEADKDGDNTGNVVSVSSTGGWTDNANATVEILGENVLSVTSTGGDLEFDDITAASGVGTVDGYGITGDITANDGNVTSVNAHGNDYDGTVTTTNSTAASPVLTVMENGLKYVIETSATAVQAEFDLVYDSTGGTPTADITMDVLSGSGYDVSVRTYNTDDSTNDAEFDLVGFAFTAGTPAAERVLGVLTVDGDASGIALSSGVTLGGLDALIVQGNVGQATLQLGSINMVAASLINGAEPTAAVVDALTTALAGADPTGTAADGDFTFPLPSGADDMEIYYLTANGTFSEADLTMLAFGPATDGEATATFAAGVLTDVGGTGTSVTIPAVPATGMDLSGFTGDIGVTGDVDGPLTLGDPASLVIGGDLNGALVPVADPTWSIGDGDGMIDITGTDLSIGGDVNVGFTVDDIADDFYAGNINDTVNVGDVGDQVSVGTINSPLTVGDVGGDFYTGAVNDANVTTGDIGGNAYVSSVSGLGTVVSFQDVTGTATVYNVGNGSTISALEVGDLNISANMNGSILLRGDNSGVIINIGGQMGSVILAVGSLGGVVSVGDLGSTGGDSLIAATEGITTLQSTNGDVNAYIFTGGDGNEDMAISAPEGEVTSAFAVGQRSGVSSLTITSGTDTDAIDADGGQMAVSAAAGNFSGAAIDLFDTVIMISDDDLTVTNPDGSDDDGANVGDIISGNGWSGDIETPERIVGTVVVSDEIDIEGYLGGDDTTIFNDLAAGLTDIIEQGWALDFANLDLDPLAQSALQATFGDDGATVSFHGDIEARSLEGLLVSDQVDSDIWVEEYVGFIVSLDADIYCDVYADTWIGSLVASGDIEGDFFVEGTIALPGNGDGADIAAALTTFGLTGVPGWFSNGILTEAGDLCDSSFVAYNMVDSNGIIVPAGDAMGPIYVLAGNIEDVTIEVNGNFTGIQNLVGDVLSTSVLVTGQIDWIIAPNWGSSAPIANVGIRVVSGEQVVTEDNPFSQNNMVAVNIVGDALAFVDYSSGSDISEILVLNFDSASDVNITGDVDYVTIMGNWAGDLNVAGSAIGETDGNVQWIDVTGAVQSTADLSAAYFGDVFADGGIDASLMDSGVLDRDDPTDQVEYKGVTQGTLYLRGGRNVEAEWDALFGKVMDVEIMGRGTADFAYAEGVQTEDDFRPFVRTGESITDGDGLTMGVVLADMRVRMRNVLVEGDVDALGAQTIRSLWIEGETGNVGARTINRAFFGDDVNRMSFIKASNVAVDGDVDSLNLFVGRNITVVGETDELNLTGTRGPETAGRLINCLFQDGVDDTNFGLNDRFVRLRRVVGIEGDPYYYYP